MLSVLSPWIKLSSAVGPADTLPPGEVAAAAADRRQGVFVSGGVVNGPVIGVNQGVFNYYQIAIGAAGTKLDDGAPLPVKILDTVSVAPRPPRMFYDRADALAALQAELRPSGGAWITGERGCGMTALLRTAAHHPLAAMLPNGIIYLDGADEPADLEEILRRLFNYYHSASAPIAVTPQAARAFLGTRRALMLFDRLPLGHGDLVSLADALGQGAVLITAEGPAPDTLADVLLGGLPRQDALRLCAGVARLDAAQPDVAPPLGLLCAALGDLPLPLVLAGRLLRAQVASPSQLATVLEEQIKLGAPGDREPLILATRLALKALGSAEHALLAALAASAGMERSILVTASGVPAAAVDTALRRLIDLGLVVAGNDRYQIASVSLHQALSRLLPVEGEQRRRVAAAFAAAAFTRIGDLEWAGREQGNLLASLETLLAEGRAADAGALARAIQPSFMLGGRWSAWRQVIDLAARAAQAAGDRALQAWALHERGSYAGLIGDRASAAADLRAARRIRRELGDRAGADLSLHNLRYFKLLPPLLPKWLVSSLAAAAVIAGTGAFWLLGPPQAADDRASGGAGQPVSIDVLANDTSAIVALDPASLTVVGGPSNGEVAIDPTTGKLTYTSRLDFTGADRFTYRICAGLGGCANANVTVSIDNKLPIAQDAAATTNPNTPVTIELLRYVNDPEGALDPASIVAIEAPSSGALAVDPQSGAATYTPRPGFAGPDRFRYQACDQHGACAAASVTIDVVNRPPVARAIVEAGRPNTAITIAALTYVDDPDGPLGAAAFALLDQPARGAATIDRAQGTIVYVPARGFIGADTFRYQVCDEYGACADAPITVDVIAQPIVAQDIVETTSAGSPLRILALKYISDPDGLLNPASLDALTEGMLGSVKVDQRSGLFVYTPPKNFIGDDRFGYRVCDRAGACVTARVTISVTPIVYTDPFAYCAVVGDIDAPAEPYVGPPVPDSIAVRLSRLIELPGGGRLPDEFIRWRCMERKVYACNLGNNLPCGKANTSRAPTAAMAEACKATPELKSLPITITGNDTIYAWRCSDGVAVIDRQIFTVDQRGFITEMWYNILN